MTYDLEVTVAKSQACAKGADQEDGLQVCSSGLSSGGAGQMKMWKQSLDPI